MNSDVSRLLDLAARAFHAGRLDEARNCARQAAALAPADGRPLGLLGVIAAAGGRAAEGAEILSRAAAMMPKDPGVHVNLGNVWLDLGQPGNAAASFARAAELVPGAVEVQLMLAEAQSAAGDPAAAAVSYRRAHSLAPGDAGILLALGAAQRSAGQWDAALASYRAAVARQPAMFEAHANMANVLRDLGRVDEALAAHRQALALAPDNAQARFGYAYSLLLAGQFEAGWRHYEARWQGADGLAGIVRPQAIPQWRGEPLAGRSIFGYHEQGFGDTIQSLRYLPQLVARGAEVTLEVPRELERLARSLPGIRVIVRGSPRPPADFECPLMSLPLAFGTTLSSIPGETPYLFADPQLVAAWQARLSPLPGPRVGLCWQGGRAGDYDRIRSLSLATLAPLAACAGISFVSLQKEAPSADGALVPADFSSALSDFAETAALIANLDLVISIDTAVAHLAGALGKPVWLLNRFNGEWRWLRGRSDSPWYPTLRIFRQPRPGDWPAVVADVARSLQAHSFPRSK